MCMNPRLQVYVLNDRSLYLKDVGIRLYPEKNLPTIFCRGKCSDTTCNIPYVKSMENKNKMLEMADEQQYNQNNTTIILK
jgi:hypothetical protein